MSKIQIGKNTYVDSNEFYIWTADDEEPDCIKCEHFADGEYNCSGLCGAEHGWNGYMRLEPKKKYDK